MGKARRKSRRKHILDKSAARKHAVAASITDVPDHIIMEICSRLSVKSICRCRSVCKNWFNTLVKPDFIQLHFERAPICPLLCSNLGVPEFRQSSWYGLHSQDRSPVALSLLEFERDTIWVDDIYLKLTVFKLPRRKSLRETSTNSSDWKSKTSGFVIVNSCNGFLCLRDKINGFPVAIYNPVTGECSILPIPSSVDNVCKPVSVFGLGFCPITNQYKVLLMVNVEPSCFSCENRSICKANVALIYTLGLEGGWRNIESPPCFECCSILNPVFLNGALHWLVKTCNTCEIYELDNIGIMSFDFEGEKFRILPPPPDETLAWFLADKILGIVRGHLYLCNRSSSNVIDLWVMKDYGIEKSWTKEYVFDVYDGERWPFESTPITDFTNNWDLLLYSPQRKSIYFIDKYLAIRYVKIGQNLPNFEVFLYVPTFISIKTIVGDSLKVLDVKSLII